MNIKFLLKYGWVGKKSYYLFEIIKNIISKITKIFKKLFSINEISQRKISKFIKNYYKKNKVEIKNLHPNTITVVIPCYNHANYLKKCFESVVNQTEHPDEIIIIDDFSSDNTKEIIRFILNNYREKLNIKIFYNEKNIGQSASLNKAIMESSSELITVLNDDDYLFFNAIEILKKLFKLYTEVALIGSTSIHFNSDDFINRTKNLIISTEFKNLVLTIHTPENLLKYSNYNDLNMTHSGCTFYKHVWEYVGGYFPNKKARLVPFSDRDFQLRVNAFYKVGVLYDTPLSLWRNNSSVDSGKNT